MLHAFQSQMQEKAVQENAEMARVSLMMNEMHTMQAQLTQGAQSQTQLAQLLQEATAERDQLRMQLEFQNSKSLKFQRALQPAVTGRKFL